MPTSVTLPAIFVADGVGAGEDAEHCCIETTPRDRQGTDDRLPRCQFGIGRVLPFEPPRLDEDQLEDGPTLAGMSRACLRNDCHRERSA